MTVLKNLNLRINFKEIKARVKQIRGMFVTHKEPKSTISEAVNHLKLQINDEFGTERGPKLEKVNILHITSGLYLPYEASGILLMGIGPRYPKYNKYLSFVETRYDITAKLGTATETHTALGKIIETKAYDHITESVLAEHLSSIKGHVCIKASPVYKYSNYSSPFDEDSKNRVKYRDNYDEADILSIWLKEFKPPFFQFEIISNGSFVHCALVDKICRELGSCGHVTELTRTHWGPFDIQDALPSYRWTESYIIETVTNQKPKFEAILSDLNKRFPDIYKKKINHSYNKRSY